MNVKFDISTLDTYTQNRIAKLSVRTKELFHGVDFNISVPVKATVRWDQGLECYVLGLDENSFNLFLNGFDWEFIENTEIDITKKINEEIKDISDFSDSCADRLGVDRLEFFNQHFA